jgi:uncharacterized membrane protein
VNQELSKDRSGRIIAIDALRGMAIIAMIIYHFAWDLSFFGFISVDVAENLGWVVFARTIAGTFVGLVGVSLVLATRTGLRLRPFLRRLAIITGAAILVTLGTWWFLPQSFVFFGILHLIAFASLAASPFLFLPTPIVLAVGVVILALPFSFTSEIFNQPFLWWLGLTSGTRIDTLDYVPVVPWFAVTLFGIVAGRLLISTANDNWFASWAPSGFVGHLLVLAGRWSLFIYLVHQLLLVGALAAIVHLMAPDPAIQAEAFRDACETSCRAAEREPLVCADSCGCVLAESEHVGILSAALAERMTEEESIRWQAIVKQCQTRI